MSAKFTIKAALTAIAIACAVASGSAQAAASFTIINGNGANVGFNDPTPAVPVGGNPGVTLGQQRLNAFQAAAAVWAAALNSTVPITILATFEPLTCTATSATLGSAGAIYVDADFPGAPRAMTLYSAAETSKLLGFDDDPTSAMIRARFNSNLGLNANCLPGQPFYLGLDNNHGALLDLVTVLIHEFGHGLGFQTFTSGLTGAQLLAGYPSVWDYNMVDITNNLTWVQMTNAQRAASALKPLKLVWTGQAVTAAVPQVLQGGTPELVISGPNSINGTYLVGTASFGPPVTSAGITGIVMPVVDQADGKTGLACDPLNAKNALAVNGKVALVDRGVCTFNVKAANVQAAGATAMIVADNAAGGPPAGLGGTDNTITIPAVRITQADGVLVKNALATRSRTTSGVTAKLDLNLAIRAGADAAGRALLYTPNPYISGSSVSHWDTSATPNLIMEPNINGDLIHAVTVPTDLTQKLLQDIGW